MPATASKLEKPRNAPPGGLSNRLPHRIDPPPSQWSILMDVPCPRCNAAIWFDDEEWKCSMCARPVCRPEPPMTAPIEDVPSPVDRFLRERCVQSPNARVAASELYAAYQAWSLDTDRAPLTRGSFARGVRAQGFDRFRTRRARYWRGLRFQTPSG